MKMHKWLALFATTLAFGAATFAVACGDTSSSASTPPTSSEQASSVEDKTVSVRFAVGETTNVSVPANGTVYCAIDETAGSYVLEWDSTYAKIIVGDNVYTSQGKVELKNITADTVIAVTTTDGGGGRTTTIPITCTLWQPPMLSLGENTDTEVAASETSSFRFSSPHAGTYAFQTQSAAVSRFSVFSDKAFENPTPLTSAGNLTIEVQAGAEIKIELQQNGTATQIIPITVTDETGAQTAEILDDTAILSAPASGRAYYILPLGQDSYITWEEENLALTIAGKTYAGAQSEPILVKYDARNPLYIVASSKDGNAVENATLQVKKATTSETLSIGETDFIIAKNKSAVCSFTAPENGVYTFSYAESVGISEISFTSGVVFPTILETTEATNNKTLTATVVKGAELVLEVKAEKTKAANVSIHITKQALQTETLDTAVTVDFSLSHGEFKCYEITAQGWYQVDYTTNLTENFWQFSCAVNRSPIESNETGYATAGDLLIIKATLNDKTAKINGSFTLQADTTIEGTTNPVLSLGENHLINRGETQTCTFTATENGTYRISTADTNAKLIYKLGATNADNECITGADDGLENSVEIELKAGETYTFYIEMLETTIPDNNEETIDPTLHLDVLSFVIEKLA